MPTATQGHVAAPRRQSVTRRAVAIAFVLLPLNAYWLGQVEGVWHGLHMSCMSLPANNLLLLIVLVGINGLVKQASPSRCLTRAELITIYALLSIQTVFLGHDNLIGLMGVLPASAWFDTPARGWSELFHQYLPDWMVVMDERAVSAFYMGGRGFYGSGLEWHWLRPALGWGALLMLLFLVHASISVLMAERWTLRERLSYPITRLPLELTDSGSPPFLRRVFWIGFAVAGSVDLLNGLSYLYPSVPHLPVREMDLRRYFPGPPFNAMGSTLVRFYPFIIGMGFLMPADVLNSCWIFFVFGKVQRIVGRAVGLYHIPRFPFQGEQAAGAMVAIVLIMAWTMRGYLRDVIATARGRDPTRSDGRRTVRYRWAMGLAASSAILLGLLCLAMGMSVAVIVGFFALYFLISIGVTRIRAEVGSPSHSMLFVNPQEMLLVWFGGRSLGKQNLTLFGLFWWFNRLNRNHPMPVALETLHMADVVRLDRTRLMAAMWVMGLVSVVAAFAIYPALFFRDGAIKAAGEVLGVGSDTVNRMNSWVGNPQPPSNWGRAFTVGGGLFAALLGLMRTRFLWWSLHPMGYVLGLSYAVDFYWASLVVAAACKGVLLRYGSNKAYSRALPFFIGLIIGECVVACGWSLLALVLHRPMYDAWW
ncbi:MAG TPA: DUF6785 family protein [Armatimonadota bacterium]|nr:DUF6785 family protein [Armatimonadota bacterium]